MLFGYFARTKRCNKRGANGTYKGQHTGYKWIILERGSTCDGTGNSGKRSRAPLKVSPEK
jgi:hypothetical protein